MAEQRGRLLIVCGPGSPPVEDELAYRRNVAFIPVITTDESRKHECDDAKLRYIHSDAFEMLEQSHDLIKFGDGTAVAKSNINFQRMTGRDVMVHTANAADALKLKSAFKDGNLLLVSHGDPGYTRKSLQTAGASQETIDREVKNIVDLYDHAHEFDAIAAEDTTEKTLNKVLQIYDNLGQQKQVSKGAMTMPQTQTQNENEKAISQITVTQGMVHSTRNPASLQVSIKDAQTGKYHSFRAATADVVRNPHDPSKMDVKLHADRVYDVSTSAKAEDHYSMTGAQLGSFWEDQRQIAASMKKTFTRSPQQQPQAAQKPLYLNRVSESLIKPSKTKPDMSILKVRDPNSENGLGYAEILNSRIFNPLNKMQNGAPAQVSAQGRKNIKLGVPGEMLGYRTMNKDGTYTYTKITAQQLYDQFTQPQKGKSDKTAGAQAPQAGGTPSGVNRQYGDVSAQAKTPSGRVIPDIPGASVSEPQKAADTGAYVPDDDDFDVPY